MSNESYYEGQTHTEREREKKRVRKQTKYEIVKD